MRKLVVTLVSPTEFQKKWATLAFVGIILSIAVFGFIADGYHDSLKSIDQF